MYRRRRRGVGKWKLTGRRLKKVQNLRLVTDSPSAISILIFITPVFGRPEINENNTHLKVVSFDFSNVLGWNVHYQLDALNVLQ